MSQLLLCCKKHDVTWISIGDSITSSNGKLFDKGPNKGDKVIGYQTIFINGNKQISIDLDNEGYSGFSLAGKERSIYQEVKNKDFSNADLITILVGTNDFKLNKPIISSDSLESFRYCYESLINKIKTQNKKIRLYLLTPLERNNSGYTSTSINKLGLKLGDYREEIFRIGKDNKVAVIDLFTESGITQKNLKEFTIDGLHPNNAGHKNIGNELIQKIILKKPHK